MGEGARRFVPLWGADPATREEWGEQRGALFRGASERAR